MTRRSSGRIGVFGAIALVVLAALATIGVVWGPKLYREGRAVGGPILDLARAEKRLDALDESFPFTPPADGAVAPDRLEAFLDVRADLKPRYQAWQALVREIEKRGDESWETAREVIIATRNVIVAQIENLERARMSKSEFRWLETTVYDDWLDAGLSEPADARLLTATEDDLGFLGELEQRFGPTRALAEVRARLESRRDELRGPEVEAGPNDALFAAHNDRIANLRLDDFQEIHSHLVATSRGQDGVTVKFGADGHREHEGE